MKKLLVVLLVVIAFASNAQSKDEKQLVERTYLLSHTVFGTKDSLTLEDLFAKQATYGHSHGNLQTREEAINTMYRALSEYVIEGVKTTIPFHLQLMQNEKFRAGDFNTKFLESFEMK